MTDVASEIANAYEAKLNKIGSAPRFWSFSERAGS